MNWKRTLEVIAWTAGGGALSAASEALSAGHFETEHVRRAAVVGAFVSVTALFRQWHRPPEIDIPPPKGETEGSNK